MSAKIVKVIMTDLEIRGDGTEEHPFQKIISIYSVNGELIAQSDPHGKEIIFIQDNAYEAMNAD